LASQHYWGEQRCRRFLRSIQISEVKPIGTMTERQRQAIAAALSDDTAHAGHDRRRGSRAGHGELPSGISEPTEGISPGGGANPVRTLKLSGEFDLSNSRQLSTAISDTVDAGIPDLVVDLSEVSFLDATTLHTLVRA